MIASAYQCACPAELDALKPGNAHRFAPHPRLAVADFELSAAVAATLGAVGHNTNLGMILLCAPLAAAAERRTGELRAALADVLDRLDVDDAFCAIVTANPSGLGAARGGRALA